MAKLSKPARRKRVAMRKLGKTKAVRSFNRVARKTLSSGARSVRKRGGAIVGHALSGNVGGLRDEAVGIGGDMKRTLGKASRKAIRYSKG